MSSLRLNHHSASILPFFSDEEGTLFFLLEQKDSRFNPPYFDNGLSFIGGNWQSGNFQDISPIDTLKREIFEEYWIEAEAEESLQGLLGESLTIAKPNNEASYDEYQLDKIRSGAQTLLQSVTHVADFVVRITPPIISESLVYGLTIFIRKLDENNFAYWKNLLAEFDGKLTTDNLRWNSSIVFKTLDEIQSDEELKFAYGYDHVLNALLQDGVICPKTCLQLKTLQHTNNINFQRMKLSRNIKKVKRGIGAGAPLYDSLEKHMFVYEQRE